MLTPVKNWFGRVALGLVLGVVFFFLNMVLGAFLGCVLNPGLMRGI